MTVTRSVAAGASLTPTTPAPAAAVHLTPGQARQLGIIPTRKRTTRQALPRDRAVTVCHTCGQRFTGETAEARHTATVGHHRYEIEL